MNQPNGVASALGNPRRLLIVKVNGMGDAVMIRSIIEHLRRRQPEIEIGVLVGRATSEVMTVGADFRVHEFGGFKALIALLRTLLAIRRCRYHAILNFEQNFPRLNLALMTAEGMGKRLDPSLQLNEAALPYLAEALGLSASAVG